MINSIWGKGDKETLNFLNTANLSGAWLNLSAGDGRYNTLLLEKADSVTATDIDEFALRKLEMNTPKRYRKKLKIIVLDLTEKFPFENKKFDGVFCTGTLHLFNKENLVKIFSEIKRVLKPYGKIIIDFATDIERRAMNGKHVYIIKNEPKYTLKEAIKFLKIVFKDYKTEIHEYSVPREIVNTGKEKYEFECKYILLVAKN